MSAQIKPLKPYFFNKYTRELPQELHGHITAMVGGHGLLFFGDDRGVVHIAQKEDREFRFRVFVVSQEHHPIEQLLVVRDRDFLVTACRDDASGKLAIKLWVLPEGDEDPELRQVTLVPMEPHHRVTCLAATSRAQQIAVGLSNGDTLLLTGEIHRQRRVRTIGPDFLTPPKRRKGEPAPPEPTLRSTDPVSVNGLQFYEEAENRIALFVVTSHAVRAVVTTGKETHLLSDMGCPGPNCCAMSNNHEFFVYTDSDHGVRGFFASIKDRDFPPGNTLAYQDECTQIFWFRTYLLAVGLETRRQIMTQDQAPAEGERERKHFIKVYDPKNKLLVFIANNEAPIRFVTSEWGAIFILTSANQLYQLEEKDVHSKLDVLFPKNYYDTAINIARQMGFDEDQIADIYRLYGDHLYQDKHDYTRAMEQYLHTIGYLEPSYVIRRFLDTQRIEQLTRYLDALHRKNQATPDHTTLLINCYTKQKNLAQLEAFLTNQRECHFDVDTAIRVCQQAGYHDQALMLALRTQRFHWYLRILLELERTQEALEFIQRLDHDEAVKNMKKYGKALVQAHPEESTRLLIDLCRTSKPDDFIHIYVDQPEQLIRFLEECKTNNPAQSKFFFDTLLELYLKTDDLRQLGATEEYNERVRERRRQASLLLRNQGKQVDRTNALVMCQRAHFRDGVLWLLEQHRLYAEMLEYLIQETDRPEDERYRDIMDKCKRFGSPQQSIYEPRLWIQALTYFAKLRADECTPELRDQHLREILNSIRTYSVLPPLPVLQILSENDEITLAVSREFIRSCLTAEEAEIRKNEERITQKRTQIDEKFREIHDLKTKARTFQISHCKHCSQRLDLPAVHFMCGHSFHSACLPNEHECSDCAPAHQEVRERHNMQLGLQHGTDMYDKFMREVSGSGFPQVAEYFGKGVFHTAPAPQDTARARRAEQEEEDEDEGLEDDLDDLRI